ncbi:MAG: 3-dehydroquinate synthase [Bacteroidota bacterium]|nr:3-dehydroquinate synthase [Bacteroidota bacterium]
MLPNSIIITNTLETSLKSLFTEHKFSKTGILVDENTHTLCYPLVKDFLPKHQIIMIKSGEANKTLHTCSEIWKKLTENHFDRKSLLINLGGGVIGDMGGFCAATYKRGIEFINIPTTLLSQVDASIGGKLGIDFEGLKNHIGVFKDPKFVLVHPGFIKTLEKNQIKSGYAEIIKHSLIADASIWSAIISKNIEDGDWEDFVAQSIEIKYKVVQEDPLEKGLRKILNFGHTVGHAVESHFLETDKPLLHGEAIAIGMICESYLSLLMAGLSQETFNEIENFILAIYGKVDIDDQLISKIAEDTLQDKKNENAEIKCTLISAIGNSVFDQTISLAQVEDSLRYYKKRAN